jgi:molybdenum cofactor cytidylyltransferase
MGGPKSILPYGGSTIAGTVVRTLLDSVPGPVVVVTRKALLNNLALPDSDRLRVVFNERDGEMIDSVEMALDAILIELGHACREQMDQFGILVLPADIPGVARSTCRRCVDAFLVDPRRIVIPRFDGARGHPIVFPLALHPIVRTLHEGLRQLFDRCADRLFYVDVMDPGAITDIDTFDAYKRSIGAGGASGK